MTQRRFNCAQLISPSDWRATGRRRLLFRNEGKSDCKVCGSAFETILCAKLAKDFNTRSHITAVDLEHVANRTAHCGDLALKSAEHSTSTAIASELVVMVAD